MTDVTQAAADDDLVITIDEEAPPPPPQETEEKPKRRTIAEATADLTRQYEEMKTRAANEEQLRQAAEARAQQHAREAHIARAQAVDSRLNEAQSAITAAEAEAAQAEADHAKALEEGNFAEVAKANRRLTQAVTDIRQYNEMKAQLETAKKEPEPPPSDPVEAFIANRTQASATWLRAHRDYVTDEKKRAKLTAAHWNALGEGETVDTSQYFENIERFLGMREPPAPPIEAPPVAAAPPPKPKPKAPPVAPVTATAGGTSGGSEVRLSKGEVAVATDGTHTWAYDDPSPQKKFKAGDPIGVQEFARRKKAMMEGGMYDKSYTE